MTEINTLFGVLDIAVCDKFEWKQFYTSDSGHKTVTRMLSCLIATVG